jgi:hypothetical protein
MAFGLTGRSSVCRRLGLLTRCFFFGQSRIFFGTNSGFVFGDTARFIKLGLAPISRRRRNLGLDRNSFSGRLDRCVRLGLSRVDIRQTFLQGSRALRALLDGQRVLTWIRRDVHTWGWGRNTTLAPAFDLNRF